MTTPRAPRLRATVLLILVAGIGFVSGIFADRLLLSGSGRAPEDAADTGPIAVIRGGSPDTPMASRRIFRLGLPEQLAEDLTLSPEQRADIERIVTEDQAELRALMQQVEPSLAAVIERSRQRILEVLTDEQIEQWRESPVLRLRGRDGG